MITGVIITSVIIIAFPEGQAYYGAYIRDFGNYLTIARWFLSLEAQMSHMDNCQVSTDTAKKHIDLFSRLGYISLKNVRSG